MGKQNQLDGNATLQWCCDNNSNSVSRFSTFLQPRQAWPWAVFSLVFSLSAVCLCMGSWLFSSPEIESQGHKSMLRVRVGISKNGNTVGLASILDRESFDWLMLNAACIFYLLFVTFNYYTGSTCYFVCRVVITAFLSRFLLITVLHFTLLQCCSILICAVKYLAYFPTLITGKVDYIF